jgi:serine/threonine protein phosphatase PrpC
LKTPASYFAVFDGHNGQEAAAYSAAHLHRHLFSEFSDFPSDLPAAITYAFEATDTALLMKSKDESIRSGTTVVIALLVPGNIYVAWAGDSQAFLVQNSTPISLVSPHKPDREVSSTFFFCFCFK